MFFLPPVRARTCLEHDYHPNRMASFTAKSTLHFCNLANSLTVLDTLTDEIYWSNQATPHWELLRGNSGRLSLRWSFQQPPERNGDRNGEANQDNNGDFQCGIIAWCGSAETTEETRSNWKVLQRDICRWIDRSLAEFNDEKDEKLTQQIVEELVYAHDVGDTIKLDDGLDMDGEALMTQLDAKETEASNWVDNEGMRPEKFKKRVQKIKLLAQDVLTLWRRYFGGPQNVDGESENTEGSLTHKTSKVHDFATWDSIGLSDRRCLRFDPVKFNDWISKTISNYPASVTSLSQSAKSLLQFAAEDLGLGLSWRMEGANGEVAVLLLGPHGSIWVKQKDRSILEPFCVSDDDDSYHGENRECFVSSASTQEGPSDEQIREPGADDIQGHPNDEESSEEPVAKRQKLTTNITPYRAPAPIDLQQQVLEKMEAIESTLKMEITNLKTSNANVKAQLEGRIETMNSSLEKETTERKNTDENQFCEIQILKADLHQTRMELAKVQQQLTEQAGGC